MKKLHIVLANRLAIIANRIRTIAMKEFDQSGTRSLTVTLEIIGKLKSMPAKQAGRGGLAAVGNLD